MKLKELKRTVNVSWSPAEQYPVLLAAGSAAQQVDASFSSNSLLELYSLNLEDPSYDLKQISSLQTQHKFHKLEWSGAGIVIGGCDGGLLEFYNADKLMNNASDALIGTSNKHSGNVTALDVNPYQKNLLASGASESEIFIWDLNNTSQPMAPGTKNQPYDHVQGLAWNQQVQHILGSTFSTRCVVWDLRKNEPIMKLSDSQSRTRWRAVCWHPGVATQLCLASEDDQAPVIQLWDLRLAASPVVTLEGHQKGALSMSWCAQDSDLLLSAGKDGKVLCWNPNNNKPGGELVAESVGAAQWVFEVRWCPRVPALLSAAGFDQRLSVHSVLGGAAADWSGHSESNILESFGADSLNALPAPRAAPAPTPRRAPQPLAAPPRYMRRPVRAKFGFGGKLITFEKCPQQEGHTPRVVHISQVVSDPDIVELAAELDAALGPNPGDDPGTNERLAEYCRVKGDASSDQNERYTWFFLRANFLPSFRSEVLNLLGFKQDEIPSKFKSLNTSADGSQTNPLHSMGASTETEAELSTDTSTDLSDALTLIERKLASVDIAPTVANVNIPNGEDQISTICRALVCGNLEEAVELCLEMDRVADALIIASLGSQELVYKVQKYHLNRTCADPVSLISDALLSGGWEGLVSRAAPAAWRTVLAALVTHCDTETLSQYIELLGDKLSQESDPALVQAATVCYLCAMSPERLAGVWGVWGARGGRHVALLAHRAATQRHAQIQTGGKIQAMLDEYALSLASQGCLQSALQAVQGSAGDLKERLQRALGIIRDPGRPQAQYQNRTRTTSGLPPARPYNQHSDVTPQYNSAVPAQYEPSWQQPPAPPRQYAPPPAPAPPLAPPTAQPPRPGSVGPTAGGITSRSKYKVDPSVQSAPLYNQYGFNNQQPQPYFNNQPEPYQPNTFAPIAPTQPNPVNGGFYNPPVDMGVAALPPVSKPVAPGWNDPPMLSKPKPKSETPVPTQAPITHPLFGVEPPQHVPLNPAPGQYPGQQPGQFLGQQPGQFPGQQPGQFPGQQPGQFPGSQQMGGQFPGSQQMGSQFPGGQYPGSQFPGGYQDQYQAQYQPPQQYTPQPEPAPVAPAAPAPPAPKAPLPSHLAPIQETFDGLREQLAQHSNNQLVKRKLEDVQRRLETLYDMLREDRLSDSCISSLHDMCRSVAAGDAGGAARGAALLAGGTDFASVASFLPALKTLFTLAEQLR